MPSSRCDPCIRDVSDVTTYGSWLAHPLVRGDGAPWMVQIFPAVYALGNLLAHYLRYKQGKWRVKIQA